jgi:hypothetical protein
MLDIVPNLKDVHPVAWILVSFAAWLLIGGIIQIFLAVINFFKKPTFETIPGKIVRQKFELPINKDDFLAEENSEVDIRIYNPRKYYIYEKGKRIRCSKQQMQAIDDEKKKGVFPIPVFMH